MCLYMLKCVCMKSYGFYEFSDLKSTWNGYKLGNDFMEHLIKIEILKYVLKSGSTKKM